MMGIDDNARKGISQLHLEVGHASTRSLYGATLTRNLISERFIQICTQSIPTLLAPFDIKTTLRVIFTK